MRRRKRKSKTMMRTQVKVEEQLLLTSSPLSQEKAFEVYLVVHVFALIQLAAEARSAKVQFVFVRLALPLQESRMQRKVKMRTGTSVLPLLQMFLMLLMPLSPNRVRSQDYYHCCCCYCCVCCYSHHHHHHHHHCRLRLGHYHHHRCHSDPSTNNSRGDVGDKIEDHEDLDHT